MIQRQVGSRVNSRTDGLDQKIGRFLEDLKNFQGQQPRRREADGADAGGVERIRDKHLGPAEQGLTRAAKNLEEAQAKSTESSKNPGEARPATKGRVGSKPEGEPKGSSKNAGEAKPAGPRESGLPRPEGEPKGSSKNAGSGAGRRTRRPGANRPSRERDRIQRTSTPNEKPAAPEPGPNSRFGEVARNNLKESRENQQAIADELQKMLDGLSEFETYRGVVKDAQNLLKEQEQTMEARRPTRRAKPT